ncbi:helix-turn-helix domain-containing protein [Macrococcus carouselicus]|uniref:Winged helix family transcriptional regulator n=1 Tax=Macrococcus carouselicus TaxID=69969 RepID=A0A9Q8CLI5_9STAP|nr:helix-turn-helix domain-containing protein [Macrococcus carouselicus]TDM03662.1 winged helix family transcriptional regulator [Macrococcus carouselicus]
MIMNILLIEDDLKLGRMTQLLHHQNGIPSKDLILDKVWHIDDVVSDNAVEALIGRLRKKISPVKIRTVRNMGYQLSE